MNRCSFCEWIPIVPGRVWPLAGHARLGQNTVVGSMAILLSWLCWGACQEEVCLDPHFLCNLTPPRLNVELPRPEYHVKFPIFGKAQSVLPLLGDPDPHRQASFRDDALSRADRDPLPGAQG